MAPPRQSSNSRPLTRARAGNLRGGLAEVSASMEEGYRGHRVCLPPSRTALGWRGRRLAPCQLGSIGFDDGAGSKGSPYRPMSPDRGIYWRPCLSLRTVSPPCVSILCPLTGLQVVFRDQPSRRLRRDSAHCQSPFLERRFPNPSGLSPSGRSLREGR